MIEGLRDIEREDVRRRLKLYLDCLGRWSSRINLTGARSDEAAFETLVGPVLGAEGFLSSPVIDVGSGNGSPGLILASLRPDISFTLLEPRAKRWAFLRDAAREMNLENVAVSRERSDEYQGPPAATLTMRAVGLQPQELKHLATPRASLLVFGGPELPGAETLPLPSGARLQRVCFT